MTNARAITNRFATRPRRAWSIAVATVIISLAAMSGLWLSFDSGGGAVQAQTACETGGAAPDGGGLARDCSTLLGLKSQLAGTATLNWSADLAMASWDGIRVGGFPKRVTRLHLHAKELTGTVPAALSQLDELQHLNLGRNQLTGSIPGELGMLSELTNLALGQNKLTGTIPAEIAKMAKLGSLYLRQNQLSGGLPEGLGTSDALWLVSVERNGLTGPLPASLSGLSVLWVSGNKWSCAPPALLKVRNNDLAGLSLPECAEATPTPTATATGTATPTATPGPLPAVTISAARATVSEGQSARFTVTRTGATGSALTVALRVSETGTMLTSTPPASVTIPAGAESAALDIPTENDSRDELDSVVTATVTAGANYTAGSPASATVTVEDNDPAALPEVTIAAVSVSVSEGQRARFTVTRTGAKTSALTVAVSVSETGSTFSGTPPASVTIPAGAESAALDMPTQDDTVDEPDSVVTATVKAGEGYSPGSPASTAVTVRDNDAPPPTSLRYDTYDTTGAVMKAGSYAFLAATASASDASRDGTAAGDESAASFAVVTTYEDLRRNATMLKINRADATGTLRDVYYGTVKAGHLIEWRKGGDCFVRYRVTSVSPASGDSRQFTVRPETYVFQGCRSGSLSAASDSLSSASAFMATFAAAKELPLAHLGGTRLPSSYAVVHGVWELYAGTAVAHETDVLVPEGSPAHIPPEFANTGTITSVTDARKFPYWREPTLPSGWQFHRLYVGGGGDLPPGYEAHFTNAAGHMALEIRGEHVVGWPLPWEATWMTNVGKRIVRELRIVANRPAVVMYSPDGPQQAKMLSARVDVYDATTETVYIVRGADASMLGGEAALERVLVIARSLFEATNPQ